jgi:hypothetical protein
MLLAKLGYNEHSLADQTEQGDFPTGAGIVDFVEMACTLAH